MRFVLPLLLMQSFALGEECVPIEMLGTSGDEIKERFNYSVQMSEDDEACTYSLQVSFKHDEQQPIPDDPSVQCNAMAGPPAVDSNGIPYLKHRSWYISFEDDIKEATGFDHVDLSFNPCGHPPLGAFTIPHYDLHFYRMTPYERTCMTCVLDLPSPACDVSPGTQTSDSGRGKYMRKCRVHMFFDLFFLNKCTFLSKAYFNVKKVFGTDDYSNMPKGFVVDDSAFVMMMGGHAWQGDQTPSPDNPWINPIYILGTYDGNIVSKLVCCWCKNNKVHEAILIFLLH